jgi:hypothetical protein
MKPHPRVVKWLRKYRKNLDMVYNPSWEQHYVDAEGNNACLRDPSIRWMVTQDCIMY